jgi:hypothetical protein
MTKSEKVQHKEDYKACFRNVCTDFIKGDYERAAYIHEHIKRMCLLTDGERVNIEKKILNDYKIEWGNFAERVILKYF